MKNIKLLNKIAKIGTDRFGADYNVGTEVENPDAIINIVDATNLSRSLFFTTQLLELGIPVVVALNKTDANIKKDNKIDVTALSEKLGCPVIETVSTNGKVLKTLYRPLALLPATGRLHLTFSVILILATRTR